MSSGLSSRQISVVIPALNEERFLPATLTRLHETLPANREIVVVDDGSSDSSAAIVEAFAPQDVRLLRTHGLGAAATRNYGARQTHGEIIVFADAHVDVPPGWYEPLLAALDKQSVGAVAPAISALGQPSHTGFGYCVTGPDLATAWLKQQDSRPYSVPMLSACFLALRRETFEAVGGFDDGMIVWGSEDTELCLRLWLLGYDLRVVPEVTVAHLFRKRHPYPVRWVAVLYNSLRLSLAHFQPERLQRVIESIKGHPDFAAALAQVTQSDILARRAALATARAHDDDWFFRRFGITC